MNNGVAEAWSDPVLVILALLLAIGTAVACGLLLRATGFTGSSYGWFILSQPFTDSWFPMGMAFERMSLDNPDAVRQIFFDEQVKFQYPPSSILLYQALDSIGVRPTDSVMNGLTWLSIAGMPVVVFAICMEFLQRYPMKHDFLLRDRYIISGLFAVSALFFYPIMISWSNGQIQGLLNLLFALSCLSWLRGNKAWAGVFIGLVCVFKPQFGLFVIWALLRGEKSFVIGHLAVFGAAQLAALGLYGWQNHFDYISVLSYISQHGEVHWDNTSINGLINRFQFPDQTLEFNKNGFAPYSAVTHVLTVASSLIIIGFALFLHRVTAASSSILDFMTAAMSFTLASPVAWGHHYGVALPVLAVLFLAILSRTQGVERHRLMLVWLFSYLALSNSWDVANLLAETPYAVLQSWRLFAVVAIVFVMYRVLGREVTGARKKVVPEGEGASREADALA